MKRLLVVATVLVIVASACSSASDQSVSSTVPPTGLSAAETAWCDDFNNFPAIAETAILAQVDGYETLEAEQARIIDKLGEAFLDNFLGGFLELEWKPTNAAGFAQACAAAYESR
jgi:hypothetical protein